MYMSAGRIIIWLLPAYAVGITCPSGFSRRYWGSFDWCISATLRTKADAAAECAHHGLHLLEVRSYGKRQAVYKATPWSKDFWLGLSCRGQNRAQCDTDLNSWSWDSDGASLTCTEYRDL